MFKQYCTIVRKRWKQFYAQFHQSKLSRNLQLIILVLFAIITSFYPLCTSTIQVTTCPGLSGNLSPSTVEIKQHHIDTTKMAYLDENGLSEGIIDNDVNTIQRGPERLLCAYIKGYDPSLLSPERLTLCRSAYSLIGQIPYVWDSKPESIDFPNNGLDCSGFVQWAAWNATGEKDMSLSSTLAIASHYTEIPETELKPGDIGMIFNEGTYYTTPFGSKYYQYEQAIEELTNMGITREVAIQQVKTHTNHVGIYIGEENGQKIFIHCIGEGEGGVIMGAFDQFTHFYSIIE